mmetsp:Transcript_16112/g.55022  ORF Transcript_16112/g.55022 Transcript_16112/m.55022 type:complete len:205 (+) Transcript_16112:396-1010(+)
MSQTYRTPGNLALASSTYAPRPSGAWPFLSEPLSPWRTCMARNGAGGFGCAPTRPRRRAFGRRRYASASADWRHGAATPAKHACSTSRPALVRKRRQKWSSETRVNVMSPSRRGSSAAHCLASPYLPPRRSRAAWRLVEPRRQRGTPRGRTVDCSGSGAAWTRGARAARRSSRGYACSLRHRTTRPPARALGRGARRARRGAQP